MLQQHIRSNIRASGKELFRLPLFYHDPFEDFQCLLKTESLPSMSHLHYPRALFGLLRDVNYWTNEYN